MNFRFLLVLMAFGLLVGCTEDSSVSTGGGSFVDNSITIKAGDDADGTTGADNSSTAPNEAAPNEECSAESEAAGVCSP